MHARRHCWHVWALALAALALLVRIMVPAGFMPMAGVTGLPGLVICPGQQPMSQMAPMIREGTSVAVRHDPAKPGPADHGGDHTCPFASLGAAADAGASTIDVSLPAMAAIVILIAAAFIRPGIGLAAPPPPKTGPPILR